MELNPFQTIVCQKVHLLDKRYPWCSADHGTWKYASNVPQTSGREAVNKKTKQKEKTPS
jgi:hypothetical protein